MMPTLGLKPSLSSIINLKFLNCVHYAWVVSHCSMGTIT